MLPVTGRLCGVAQWRGRSPTWLAPTQIGAALSMLLALLIAAALAAGHLLPPGDQLLFVSRPMYSGVNDIQIADVDRGLVVSLLRAEFWQGQVLWLPGSNTVVLQTYIDGVYRIFLLDIDAGAVQPLLDDAAMPFPHWNPVPSPDGARLAFMAYRDSTNRRSLYLTDLPDRRTIRELLDTDVDHVAWSPDSRKLAFTAVVPAQVGMSLFVIDVEGGEGPRLLGSGLDIAPSWSPDGSQIAFQSSHMGNTGIYVVDVASGDLRNLTVGGGSDHHPVWSPTGDWIAFDSTRGGDSEIYVIHSDGSRLRALTDNSYPDQNPTWSPDGRRIAFESYLDGFGDIYIIDADGGNLRRLSSSPRKDAYPAWRPRVQ